MILYKTQKEIEIIREGGKILARVLDSIIRETKPGVSTQHLENMAVKLMHEAGGEPSFKGYTIGGSPEFPTALCTSIDDEIVHAPATPGRKLQEGEIVGIDVGMKYKGLYTDMAKTVAVGKISPDAQALLEVTQGALEVAIGAVKLGNTIGSIGNAIEDFVTSKGDYGIVKEMVGHGVGKKVHEPPEIPNYRSEREDIPLEKGMVLALEPMITLGDWKVIIGDDEWTVSTVDGSLAAQFEHTVAIDHEGKTRVMTDL